ncbi:MAG: hypothetical protein KTR15_01930 [Phycisphaeraceae bacterium]|nr:hypothetical protein [Phycisphaeraceae bacterium]
MHKAEWKITLSRNESFTDIASFNVIDTVWKVNTSDESSKLEIVSPPGTRHSYTSAALKRNHWNNRSAVDQQKFIDAQTVSQIMKGEEVYVAIYGGSILYASNKRLIEIPLRFEIRSNGTSQLTLGNTHTVMGYELIDLSQGQPLLLTD